MAGVIAIVGRPNVGKSALFNRIVGKRIAIVHDEPGVTRDRIIAEAEWKGRSFTLVDTGGIGLLKGEKARDPLVQAALAQVQVAIDSADAILLVVDLQEGLTSLDHEVAVRLRTSGKPVLLVINKADRPEDDAGVGEYAAMGFSALFPVSAIHGRGLPALMQAVVELLPASIKVENMPPGTAAAQANEPLKLAIIGRPNVGKSSLINALTRSERVIVTPIPGTTRDSVDVPFEVDTDGQRQQYILIDTAGIRKRRRVDDSIEFFSVKRSEDSIIRCDIAIFVLDAESGIMEQDKKIADLINAANKACIVVINKWDLYADTVNEARNERAQQKPRKPWQTHDTPLSLFEFGNWVQEQLFFLDYAPVIFTSALQGFNLERLLEAVRYVAAQRQQKIPTAILNRAFQDIIERRQPISDTGHFLRLFYATQVESAPPTFWLFVNRKELFSPAYKKYLCDQLRRAFGFEGCPIVLVAKPRPKTVESKRTRRPAQR